MTVRGSAVHINHNHTLFTELSTLNHCFIMVACPVYILESTKCIEMKVCTYIDVNEGKCRRQCHNPILYFT